MLEKMEIAERINKVIEIRKLMVKGMLNKDEKSHWALLREQEALAFEGGKMMLSEHDWEIIDTRLKDWANETGIFEKF